MTTHMTLVILAVTHMKTGICIAGVRQDTPATWVRPVREFGSILLGDITYPAGPASGGMAARSQRRVMRPFDVVEFGLGHARPAPPHIEDWTCNFAHQRPRLLGVLPASERAALLDAACYLAETVWRGARSLGAIACEHLSATFRHDSYSGKYEARLTFAGLPAGTPSAACTDLKWRALGRRLLGDLTPSPSPTRRGEMDDLTPSPSPTRRGEMDDLTPSPSPPDNRDQSIERGEQASPFLAQSPGPLAPPSLRGKGAGGIGTLTLSGGELLEALGGPRRIWLALGTSRALDGRNWPLVVGVHTLPEYEAEVDYTTP